MHLRVLHRTTFNYAGKAHDSFNETRLRPINDATQRCIDFKLRLTPGATPREYDDFYGNTVVGLRRARSRPAIVTVTPP